MNHRALLACAIGLLSACAQAQLPNVQVKIDASLTYDSVTGGDNTVRWYTPLGRHSTAGLALDLEQGFRVFVSERFQRINNDGDSEQLDEYYIEDPGSWRVGKQYLPFGRGGILHESARAARGDTNLILNDLPISVAIADNGRDRTRGVSGRIGKRVGVSFAVGNNFGIQGTSLDLVRLPEDAPGPGRGYRLALGVDGYKRVGMYEFQAEAVALRNGQTIKDPTTEISDVSVSLIPNRYHSYTLGWSRDWHAQTSFFRATASIFVTRSVYLEPIVRMKDSVLFDAGVSLRVKM